VPTYTYACAKCGHSFDVFHPMTANPQVKCEACGSRRCERQLGTGAGIIFKGSGFYETDYKGKKGATTETDSRPPAKDDGKGKSKSENKTSSSGTPKAAATNAKD